MKGIEYLVLLPVIAGLAYFLLRKKGGKDDITAPVTKPSTQGWQLQWSRDARMFGNTLQIPSAPGVVGTVTKLMGLEGKTRIRLHFKLEGEVTAEELPLSPATITLYFQRRGDDWTAKGAFEAYRWYCPSKNLILRPGEFVIEAALSDLWSAVMVSNNITNPGMFEMAVRDCERVGFVLGGADGLAHGVVGPATLTVLEFTVE